jgi:hypothetical protein
MAALMLRYGGRGFSIVAVPCNQVIFMPPASHARPGGALSTWRTALGGCSSCAKPAPPAKVKRLYRARGFTGELQAWHVVCRHVNRPGTLSTIIVGAGVILQKGNCNGRRALPLYDFLKVSSGDTRKIAWNYTKFLVGRDGRAHGRFPAKVTTISLAPDVEKLLATGADGADSGHAAAVGMAKA